MMPSSYGHVWTVLCCAGFECFRTIPVDSLKHKWSASLVAHILATTAYLCSYLPGSLVDHHHHHTVAERALNALQLKKHMQMERAS